MADKSALDTKYFVSGDTYNCPFCNRRSVMFEIFAVVEMDWTDKKSAIAVFVRCHGEGCRKTSMHLSFDAAIVEWTDSRWLFRSGLVRGRTFDTANLDASFFYSQPTSFFTIDEKIPRRIREMIEEARNSRHSNLLVGGSACLRKAIYELLGEEKIPKDEDDGKGGRRERHYEDRVRDLKAKREHMDPTFVDVLAHTLELTSDQLHEDSWDGWAPAAFDAVMEALMGVLREMYIVPGERKERAERTAELVSRMKARVQGQPVPVREEAVREEEPRR